MKKIYLSTEKHFYFAALFLMLSCFGAKAQFTSAGDIAFTGYIAADAGNNESFSFVLLKNKPAGSILNFTDRGWNGSAFNATTESLCTWTTGTALTAGREVTISGLANSTTMTVTIAGSAVSPGTVTGTMPSFPTSGDQVLAYVGAVTSPTFIAGMHMNSYNNGNGGSECGSTTVAGWDPPACANPGNANSSALPVGLIGGTTAVYVGLNNSFNSDVDNARYGCSGPLATANQVRTAVNTYNGSNWTTVNGTPTFTLPSGCAYLGAVVPIDILSFFGNNESNYIAIKWNTANEDSDKGRFELEKSADGKNFNKIASLNAQGFSYLYNNYSYNDLSPLNGLNYYRLKINLPNGETKYSNVVKVLFGKLNKQVTISPSITSNEFSVSFTGNKFTQLVISDFSGRVLMQQQLASNSQRVDVSRLPAGQYSVSLIGSAEKITEKIVIVR